MQINAIRVTSHASQLVPLIELKDVTMCFGEKTALQQINMAIYPNVVTTIVGPNGGGKSTLLKILLKLIKPTSGQVLYGQDVRIGYVPQKIHVDQSFPITVKKFLSLKKCVEKYFIIIIIYHNRIMIYLLFCSLPFKYFFVIYFGHIFMLV